jgi:hypothetical protein
VFLASSWPISFALGATNSVDKLLLQVISMGRTVITSTQLLQKIQDDDWSKFRRALRQEDQKVLDELFALARFHTAPMAYASTPAPMEAVLIAMLIEMMKRIRRLELNEPPLREREVERW